MNHPPASRRQFLKSAALGGLGTPVLGSLCAVRDAFGAALHRLDLATFTNDTFPTLRDEYLLSPDITYLNHASIGTIPRIVHEARRHYLTVCESNPWLHMWGGAWEDLREDVRAGAARLLNCLAEEVAILHNTTEAFNVLAHGLPLGPGDEVVFSSLNHTGASAAFFHMAEVRGFDAHRFAFPVLDVPTMTKEDVLSIYDRHITPRTKLLVLPHIDNTVGLRHPIPELAQLARDKGVAFIAVDAAQTVGMIPVDMQSAGVDVVATSPHKWLQAPKGLGLAYVSQAVQDVLRPMWVTWGQNRWKGTARIFEDYGTRNFAEVLALGDAIDFQARLNQDERVQRLRALWTVAHAAATENPGSVWRSPRSWDLSGSLYAIEIRDRDSSQLFDIMFKEHGFVFRPFQVDGINTVRLSPNVMNTEDEISRFFEIATGH
ncbi:MAG: aminotransferase class V-fold PLP-dependent enzyme [Rhodothermales bacterium]